MEKQQTNEMPQQIHNVGGMPTPTQAEPKGETSWNDFSPEEMKEFKEWDVTLMDGLEEEPNAEQQSEPKQEPQKDECRELTYGEQLVGISFNPSNNEKVDRIKRLCAELADIVNEHQIGKGGKSNLQHHLYINTIGEILNAQMNAVKLITFKY